MRRSGGLLLVAALVIGAAYVGYREYQERPLVDVVSPQPEVRLHAVRNLTRQDNPVAVQALIKTLGDSEQPVNGAARQALRASGARLLAALVAAQQHYVLLKTPTPGEELRNERRCTEISALLAALGKPAVAPLRQALLKPDYAYRLAVLHTLSRIDDPAAIDALAAVLGDTDLGMQAEALTLLGQSADPRAVPHLLVALRGSNVRLRRLAVQGLATTTSADAVDALRTALKDKDAQVRKGALFALGATRNPRGLEILISLLKSTEDADRRQAVETALIRYGPGATDTLFKVMGEEEFALTRQAIAYALKGMDDAGVNARLVKGIEDGNRRVRESCAMGLEVMDTPEANTALDAALTARRYDIIAMVPAYYIGKGTPGSEPVLIEAMNREGGMFTAGYLLNTGNATLVHAARRWAANNGFVVSRSSHAQASVAWGSSQR